MKNTTNFDYVVKYAPDAYKVAIAMHACDMKERFRQARLKALGEKDDKPYLHSMYGRTMR